MAAGMRQHEVVGHRRDDDAGHDRHVQIGIGQPRQPPRLAGVRNLLGAGFGALVEIDPPHRDAAEQRGRTKAMTVSVVQVRSAKVAPVTTMDSPSAMMMKPAQRSAMWPPSTTQSDDRGRAVFRNPEPRRRRDIFDRQRHRPQREPRTRPSASPPAIQSVPDIDSQTRMRTAFMRGVRPIPHRANQQEDGAPDLHRAIGQCKPKSPRFKRLGDGG